MWSAPRSRWTNAEWGWWRKHGQEIVNTAAADYGPDVIGLLRDGASYGVAGDHGGAQEAVQRIPIVFSGPGVRAGSKPGAAIRSVDIMPTVLQALGIPRDLPDGREGLPAALASADVWGIETGAARLPQPPSGAGPVDARTTSWVGSTRMGESTGRAGTWRTRVSTARAPASSVRSARVVSGRVAEVGAEDVVEADDAEVAGHDLAALGQPPHQADRQHVVVADHGRGARGEDRVRGGRPAGHRG